MAAIKSRDTKPELIVRKYLFSRGLRFRVQVKSLPGSPDIVFPKYKTVVFINGCFWHGHKDCKFFKLPKTNIEYWERKISHNIARDISNSSVLKIMGWKVITIWECELRNQTLRDDRLEHLYCEITNNDIKEAKFLIAAEPPTPYD